MAEEDKDCRLVCAVSSTPHCKLCGSTSSICSRTGLPHIILKGTVNGKVRTKLAEPYPPPFASAGARWIINSAEAKTQAYLQQLLL